MPTELLGEDWLRLLGNWGDEGEERPPVFILVCKNTRLAKVVYEWLAEGEAPAGVPEFDLPALRNSDGNAYTIRVDSKVIGETDVEGAPADETAWMRFTLDTVGKRELAGGPEGRPALPGGVRGAGGASSAGRSIRRGATSAASSASGC